MQNKKLDPKKKYNFNDYFDMDIPFDELLTYFGYQREIVENYPLPRCSIEPSFGANLKTELFKHIRFTTLNSETARREALIAPIMFKLALYLETPLQIEYSLRVNHQLGGKLDYYMHRANNILVVEAKQGDLQRGFTQLAVELIALDKWLEPDEKPLYGCISVGDIWRFGVLDRQRKEVTEDLNTYNVPGELEVLLSILVGILES